MDMPISWHIANKSTRQKVRPERFENQSKIWHLSNMKLRLKELRKERGWTGDNLADVLDISKGYVSELETGKKAPGGRLLMRIAAAFNCSVADLFDGSEADRDAAELTAHIEVMRDLSPEDRKSIVRTASALLQAQQSSEK